MIDTLDMIDGPYGTTHDGIDLVTWVTINPINLRGMSMGSSL